MQVDKNFSYLPSPVICSDPVSLQISYVWMSEVSLALFLASSKLLRLFAGVSAMSREMHIQKDRAAAVIN